MKRLAIQLPPHTRSPKSQGKTNAHHLPASASIGASSPIDFKNSHNILYIAQNNSPNTMKFSMFALLLARSANAFAPSGVASTARLSSTTAAASLKDLATTVPGGRVKPSTELNLFGMGKAKQFNSSAKVDGEITEKEVRALFELWNAALATGDSRIVASRYTKVRIYIHMI